MIEDTCISEVIVHSVDLTQDYQY